MKIVNLLIIAPLIPFLAGCSALETKEVKEYEMKWVVDRDQENDGHFLVEFEFVNFPGHKVGHFSNALIEHLENKAQKKIVIEFELTYSIFDKLIGFSEKSIDGLQHMFPPSLTLQPREILQNLHSKDFVPESFEFIEPRQVFFLTQLP